VLKKIKYSPHPSIAMVQKWVRDLPEKTGRNLDQWMDYILKEGPGDEKQARGWLKERHGIGTNTAWWLAERAYGKDKSFAEEDPKQYLKQADKFVEAMFAKRQALVPIYYALIELGFSMGKDVIACPCQTIVPLYRNHVFAQIKPATLTRIDFGLALKDAPVSGKMIDTGGFEKKDRISRKFEIFTVKDITSEVKKWLKKAYEMDGEKKKK